MFRFSRVSSSVKAAWLSTITRPSRSRSFPRGASTGTVLMRLRSASWLLLSPSRTCSTQKPVIRKRKMATMKYWNPAMRPSAKRVSSRDRRWAASGRRSCSGSMAILFHDLQFIQYMKQGQRDHCVERGHHQSRLQIEVQRLAQQSAHQHPVKKLVKKEKEETQAQAYPGILHVEALAHGGGEVAD